MTCRGILQYAFRPDWSLRGGVLYLSSGLEDEDRTLLSRFDAIWAIGGGVEHALKSGRKVSVDITYFQFGDGEFTTTGPIVGTISGEYDTHYGVSLSVASSF
jgi:opacity protein-like surface antigen